MNKANQYDQDAGNREERVIKLKEDIVSALIENPEEMQEALIETVFLTMESGIVSVDEVAKLHFLRNILKDAIELKKLQ